jgi:hypothetical protein
MNPGNEAWLPVLHAERGGRQYTALYSNTPRAHERGKTHDWVVIYYRAGGEPESQCTVITSEGALEGRHRPRTQAEARDTTNYAVRVVSPGVKRTVAIVLLVLLLAAVGRRVGVPEPACRPQPIMACCATSMAGGPRVLHLNRVPHRRRKGGREPTSMQLRGPHSGGLSGTVRRFLHLRQRFTDPDRRFEWALGSVATVLPSARIHPAHNTAAARVIDSPLVSDVFARPAARAGVGSSQQAHRRSIMRMAVLVLMFFVLVASSGAALACSQCECGSPTPPGYLLDTAYQRFSYGLEDRYLSKENALAEAPGHEEQWEHRISGLLYYRPSERIGMQLRVPYVFKTNEESVTGESPVRNHADGFGDVAVRARLEVARFVGTTSPPRTLALIADATAPTGSNNLRDDSGERLEAHLQPGTGAWTGTGGAAFDIARLGSALSASVLYRVNGTNSYGYHYGNTLLLNAGYARTLSHAWEAALELNARSAKRT